MTRSGRRASALVAALEAAGAAVLELPLTRQIDPSDGGAALRSAAAGVRGNRWVVLTSVNAVERFMAVLRDARALGDVQVAAVGPATADALRRTGVEPDLVPARHSAQGLVDEFPSPAPGDPGPPRVLFPGADLAADTLVEGLGRMGWDVERVEAYRTVPLDTPDPHLVARVAGADALVFGATSSVRAFSALRTAEGAPVPAPGLVLCLGPTTAAAVRAAGYDGVHEAPDASPGATVAVLVDLLGSGADAAP
ncbi:MAG: uroporphyrinogen-III synthase [Acidimicrobiales bacterium]|nr:uroporphyrinogen-III synthase [Acidimicrobiales bacterium]